MSTQTLHQYATIAREHWRQFLPSMYRALEEGGRLEKTAQQAAQRTLSDQASLIASGQSPQEAWEAVRDRYLLLPPETTPTAQSDLTDVAQDLMTIFRQIETE